MVDLREDACALDAASVDAGLVVFRKPHAVVAARSVDDVVEVIRWANRSNSPVAVRGAGHVHGGQVLSSRGLVVDMLGLDRIGAIEGGVIQAQGGAMWRDVVVRALAEGHLPRVLTNNLDTTVGGTLSTGGLGRSTHLFGLQTDNVEELEVVTGAGDLVTCSPTVNRDLFHATLGGLGQFAVIVKARIRLRRAPLEVRTFRLLYLDLPALQADLEKAIAQGRFAYLRCWHRHRSQRFGVAADTDPGGPEWQFPLHASVEFAQRAPDRDEVLDGLSPDRLVGIEDQSAMAFSDMQEPLPRAALRLIEAASGSRAVMGYPVTEGLLAWTALPEFAQRLTESLPPWLLGWCNIMLRPISNRLLTSPMVVHPDTRLGMGFGLVPFIPRLLLPRGLKIAERLGRLLTEHGGKRYLTGWVDFDHAQWREHYGAMWPRIHEWKSRYDPRGILNPQIIRYRSEPE